MRTKQKYPCGTNFTGMKFGKLTLLNEAPLRKSPKGVVFRVWNCRCECGTEKAIRLSSITQGITISCGCWNEYKKRKENCESAKNYLFTNYRLSALKRGLPFGMDREFFDKIIFQNCFYCGGEPNQKKTKAKTTGTLIFNGIDRIDNSKGYFPKNLVPCCFICNRAKGTLTVEKFLKWIEKLHSNLKARNEI